MSEWISVKDRLPEDDSTVLVVAIAEFAARITFGMYRRVVKIFDDDEDAWEILDPIHNLSWSWASNQNAEVTHWMPLPELPEEGET